MYWLHYLSLFYFKLAFYLIESIFPTDIEKKDLLHFMNKKQPRLQRNKSEKLEWEMRVRKKDRETEGRRPYETGHMGGKTT